MKKYVYLIICLGIVALFCACGKTNDPSGNPSVTEKPNAQDPTPTEAPITPVPKPKTIEMGDSFEVIRLFSPGTIVITDGMSEGDIKRNFFIEECPKELRNELQTAGLFKPSVAGDIVRLRALYKNGEQTVIGEMYVSRYQAKEILDFYYGLFVDTAVSHGGYGTLDDFIHEAELKWKQIDSVYLNNRFYYYLDISNK